jgi:hypothetical protein
MGAADAIIVASRPKIDEENHLELDVEQRAAQEPPQI